MAVTKKASASKRKPESDADAVKSGKRARTESKNKTEANGTSQDRIVVLASQIFESKKNLNNIVTLLEIARGEQDKNANGGEHEGEGIAAIASLCGVFVRLLTEGSLTVTEQLSGKKAVVVNWLRERLEEYEIVLMKRLGSLDDISTVLAICMQLLQAEGRYLRPNQAERSQKEKEQDGDYSFPATFLTSITRNLVLSRHRFGVEVGEELIKEYVETWASEYSDIVFYTFKAVTANLHAEGDSSLEAASENEAATDGSLYLLSLIDDVPESSEEFETFFIEPAPRNKKHPLYSVFQHKKQAQQAWLAVLRLATSEKQRRQVLSIMALVIAPWFTLPEMLLDFITDSYNTRSTSLLALSGLYYLIRERNVDYPAFYQKLYSLVDGEFLHSKHRAKTFRLMDEFLASTHLPVQIVASFIKRLARLCLNAPPSAIVIIVPWVYNMLKKHPLCTFMVHRVPRTEEERELLQNQGMSDPFLPDEADPKNTNAIDSCLWELVQIQTHYHPQVAAISKIITEQFTKQSYNMEDFLDHSYRSIFNAELRKEIKKDPAVEYNIPKSIFLVDEDDTANGASPLTQLWDFS